MKKIIAILTTLFFLGSNFSSQAQDANNTHVQNSDSLAALMRKVFTGFHFQDVRSKNIFTYESMPDNEPIMLMYFRSDCGHCNITAAEVRDYMEWYPIQLWMVSAEPMETIKTFVKKYELDKARNTKLMQDDTKGMHQWFDFKYIPYVVLIDKSGNLIKEFHSLPKPKEIQDFLKELELAD